MKRFIIILLFSLGITACIPPGGGGSIKIRAKLIRVTCASRVIQILDNRFYYLGETWSDMYGDPSVTYEHAAKVSNPCEFPNSIVVGQEFFFKINTHPNNDCLVCTLYDAPPIKKVAVTVVP